MEKIGILVNEFARKVFFVVLFIYWFLIAFLDPDKGFVKYSYVYWLFILPVFILLIVFFANFILNYKKYFSEFFFHKNSWSRLFVLWFFISTCIALFNRDLSSLRIIIPWTMLISSLVIIKLPFKINYLNVFFALSILSSIIGYHTSLNQFGYFLGQSQWNCFLIDRVSLYPSIFDSAFVSFIVLTFNIFYNKGKTRYPIILLSTYFILFSANRTTYLCLCVLLAFLLVHKIFKVIPLRAFIGIVLIAFLSLTLIIMYPNALVKNKITGNTPSLDKYIFHKSEDQSCSANLNESGASEFQSGNNSPLPYYHIYGRGELFRKMFSEFKQSPLLGTGQVFTSKGSNLPDRAGGSESFLAGLFVRLGISTILFIFSFIFLAYTLYQKRAYAEFVLSVSALISWLLFGSSASIYNFNFLLTISLLLSSDSRIEEKNIKV